MRHKKSKRKKAAVGQKQQGGRRTLSLWGIKKKWWVGREGGAAVWGPGTACEALGRPKRQTGRPHGLQH